MASCSIWGSTQAYEALPARWLSRRGIAGGGGLRRGGKELLLEARDSGVFLLQLLLALAFSLEAQVDLSEQPLVSDLEAGELEDVVIAVVGAE